MTLPFFITFPSAVNGTDVTFNIQKIEAFAGVGDTERTEIFVSNESFIVRTPYAEVCRQIYGRLNDRIT